MLKYSAIIHNSVCGKRTRHTFAGEIKMRARAKYELAFTFRMHHVHVQCSYTERGCRTDVVGPRVDKRAREGRAGVQRRRAARVADGRHAVSVRARTTSAAEAELHQRARAARALQPQLHAHNVTARRWRIGRDAHRELMNDERLQPAPEQRDWCAQPPATISYSDTNKWFERQPEFRIGYIERRSILWIVSQNVLFKFPPLIVDYEILIIFSQAIHINPKMINIRITNRYSFIWIWEFRYSCIWNLDITFAYA